MSVYEFSNRPVGVELEIPEFCSRLHRMETSYDWNIKEDGSIPNDGRELVSPPMTGEEIENQIRRVYEICEEEEVRTEHSSCGTHVHINAEDIYAFINSQADPTESNNRVEEWGMVMSCLSRLLVGPGRNGTRFARGGFAIRDSYRCDPKALKKSRREEYPTLAIREGTFEFRIFPSTTRADFTVARAAFCQAAGDWLLRNLSVAPLTFKRRLATLASAVEGEGALADPMLLKKAFAELKITGSAADILSAIFERFRNGNLPTLPALWKQERDTVRIQMVHRVTALNTLLECMESQQTPQKLREFLERLYSSLIA